MSHLALHNITKRWGEKTALDNICFEAEEGTFVALLGPSGCGKSTLLRTIAGLETADEGTVSFSHRDITHLPPSERKLSMVFQSYALFPHLSVRENLLFGLKARGEDRQTFAGRLSRVSKLMELETLLDRLPAQLSGGQQQRVALGRAVIANNTLCLMDEPLSNLDAKLRQSMRREIRALQRALGLTMLYVTHDQTEAMSMADRIILLNDGRIEQHDTPDNLYNNPASIFAAQFIGAPPMNILPLTSVNGRHFLSQLTQPVVSESSETALSLGIRAEDIQFIDPHSAGLTANVVNYEYMGADTLVVCQLTGSQAVLTVTVPGMKRFNEGHLTGLQWPVDKQYLFSTASGKRCLHAEQQMSASFKQYAV
ncbi:ABC transporter ATP-binding protein [Pantoea stewartii]|uniref:ABC transporter ATP-binding protein n=1 Tax=Pantoea stewartii TaxID=66269 RepID=A0AB34VDD3_9GAMM|nr:ABC transporter ATP-binding protein [Pantoea stewartii]KHE01033.1 ABC transporter ATP-binding protein [Pantoea stewartii]KHN63328.1 ABC transporter ATP-binding protein [Pantoea stewartii]KTS73551.1 ABC transporter ATP-binding protein [Pantoea stewartii]KTS96649.1 ABC transporter ATP-binding protein [Pantoea stewartii]KTT06214.1 ABC transporter ATP-binding protein [Pantoea stewartii]